MVTNVAVRVAVAIGLVRIVVGGAVVARIRNIIVVGVCAVIAFQTDVASIAIPIVVAVDLICVVINRAVVARIRDAIAIRIRARRRRTIKGTNIHVNDDIHVDAVPTAAHDIVDHAIITDGLLNGELTGCTCIDFFVVNIDL